MHTYALGIAFLLAFVAPAAAQASVLLKSVDALERHITGTTPLSATQIDAHKKTIDANRNYFASSQITIQACFRLVSTYDRLIGPLWVSRGQFDRRTATNDIHWTIYHVMQYVVDEIYTPVALAQHESVLKGFKFGCSANFPGAVSPPSNPNTAHTVNVNGSFPDTWGRMVMHEDRAARKPTGTYLAPGSIGIVTVPSSLVGKGYQIRVGAHSWDMTKRPWVRRLDRSTTLYDIKSTTTKVASPLGGGIYIEVPPGANAGVVQVSVKNAVRSPYFSAKSFHKTTLTEWRNVERHHKGPWADFQSDKFMMQVPTGWIYNLSDPVTLMQKWDAAMDATNDLMGFPRIRGKEAHYAQVDVIFRASAYAPGYPSVNITYNPKTTYNGNHTHHLVRGPKNAGYYEFHEMGHGYLFQKFSGETESNVNLLHVAVWNQKFGYDLDTAFRSSMGFGSNAYRTLENTAVAWMTVQNFKYQRPMASGEKAYQLKGHAKFVEVARMFGWKVLGDYWKSFNEDYENKVSIKTDTDSLLFRMTKHVGVDVTPLFHFWGIHPNNSGALRLRIQQAKIPSSPAVLAVLRKYMSLVPSDNAAFQSFARSWWGHVPRSTGYWTERDHALIWNTYDEKHAELVRANIGKIIRIYFPNQGASVTEVGKGCIASGKLPRLTASDPTIGTKEILILFDVQQNIPGLILLGVPHAGLSVGFGCNLYIDPGLPTIPLTGTTTNFGLIITTGFSITTSMFGTVVGAQGAVRDAATGPFGLALSNGIVLKAGF